MDLWSARKEKIRKGGRGSPGILTPAQREDVARRVREGHTESEIVRATGVSPRTVAEVMGKKGAHGKAYRSYQAILRRCYNVKVWDYKYYGGRGVEVCPEWRHDFSAFLAHVGEPPQADLTLDRIDGTKGYEPGNCRWATRLTQARNRPDYNVLNERRASMIVALHEAGFSGVDIAAAFCIQANRVHHVISGRNWAKVDAD